MSDADADAVVYLATTNPDPVASDPHANSPLPHDPTAAEGVLPLDEEKEQALRARVVEVAKEWIGTPYHQLADIKGAGIDCSMLLVRVFVDAEVLAPFDPRPYPPNWHMHRSEERYLEWFDKMAVEIPEGSQKEGDIAVFRFGRCFAHAGIIANRKGDRIVHAWAANKLCDMANLTDAWLYWFDSRGTQPRPRKFFNVFAKLRQLPGGFRDIG